MACIELHDVSKTYGEHTAVRGLDMTIADGELLVLLGPSGCGKSTTMNMIAGLDSPTSGAIRFDGVDVTHCSPHERNIAMVFQSSLLYPHLSARQNIYMSLKRSGLSKSEIAGRIARAAETVDVTRLLDKLPSQLSGGQRRASPPQRRSCASQRAFFSMSPSLPLTPPSGCRSAPSS
jgi:ABC-type sugar transport system ATPase subunit